MSTYSPSCGWFPAGHSVSILKRRFPILTDIGRRLAFSVLVVTVIPMNIHLFFKPCHKDYWLWPWFWRHLKRDVTQFGTGTPAVGSTTKLKALSEQLTVTGISGSIQNKAEFSSLQIASCLDTLPADKIGFFYSSQSIVFTLSERVIKPLSWKFPGLCRQGEHWKRVRKIA